MKIFIAHATNFDFLNKLYTPLRNSELNNYHTFLLPQEKGKEVITKDIIKNMDLLIVDVSLPSTGAGIEMGWSNAFNIPIICIYEKDSKFSSATKYVTDKILEYSDSENLIFKLTECLSDMSSNREP